MTVTYLRMFIRITDHMRFEDAFRRRNEINLKLHRDDRIIRHKWVYEVEWQLPNGELTRTWELEQKLLVIPDLILYKWRETMDVHFLKDYLTVNDRAMSFMSYEEMSRLLSAFETILKFIQLAIVMPQYDRRRIVAILGHMSFEEAFLRRNEIPINLTKSDIVSHSKWVYLVEWKLSNGALIKTWEPGDYLDCDELDEYNKKHRLTEDRNKSWALVHFTCVKGKADNEEGENEQK